MIRWWTTEVRLPRYLFWPMVISVMINGSLVIARFFTG